MLLCVLLQVIMNGLANAAKYGRARGEPAAIELRAALAAGGGLVIEVLDRGRGLRGRTLEDLRQEFSELPNKDPEKPQEKLANLAESALNRVRSTGTGIPLSVKLAALMGGALELTDGYRADGTGECGAARGVSAALVTAG